MNSARVIPRKLQTTSMRELTRPGIKIWAVSTPSEMPPQMKASLIEFKRGATSEMTRRRMVKIMTLPSVSKGPDKYMSLFIGLALTIF